MTNYTLIAVVFHIAVASAYAQCPAPNPGAYTAAVSSGYAERALRYLDCERQDAESRNAVIRSSFGSCRSDDASCFTDALRAEMRPIVNAYLRDFHALPAAIQTQAKNQCGLTEPVNITVRDFNPNAGRSASDRGTFACLLGATMRTTDFQGFRNAWNARVNALQVMSQACARGLSSFVSPATTISSNPSELGRLIVDYNSRRASREGADSTLASARYRDQCQGVTIGSLSDAPTGTSATAASRGGRRRPRPEPTSRPRRSAQSDSSVATDSTATESSVNAGSGSPPDGEYISCPILRGWSGGCVSSTSTTERPVPSDETGTTTATARTVSSVDDALVLLNDDAPLVSDGGNPDSMLRMLAARYVATNMAASFEQRFSSPLIGPRLAGSINQMVRACASSPLQGVFRDLHDRASNIMGSRLSEEESRTERGESQTDEAAYRRRIVAAAQELMNIERQSAALLSDFVGPARNPAEWMNQLETDWGEGASSVIPCRSVLSLANNVIGWAAASIRSHAGTAQCDEMFGVTVPTGNVANPNASVVVTCPQRGSRSACESSCTRADGRPVSEADRFIMCMSPPRLGADGAVVTDENGTPQFEPVGTAAFMGDARGRSTASTIDRCRFKQELLASFAAARSRLITQFPELSTTVDGAPLFRALAAGGNWGSLPASIRNRLGPAAAARQAMDSVEAVSALCRDPSRAADDVFYDHARFRELLSCGGRYPIPVTAGETPPSDPYCRYLRRPENVARLCNIRSAVARRRANEASPPLLHLDEVAMEAFDMVGCVTLVEGFVSSAAGAGRLLTGAADTAHSISTAIAYGSFEASSSGAGLVRSSVAGVRAGASVAAATATEGAAALGRAGVTHVVSAFTGGAEASAAMRAYHVGMTTAFTGYGIFATESAQDQTREALEDGVRQCLSEGRGCESVDSLRAAYDTSLEQQWYTVIGYTVLGALVPNFGGDHSEGSSQSRIQQSDYRSLDHLYERVRRAEVAFDNAMAAPQQRGLSSALSELNAASGSFRDRFNSLYGSTPISVRDPSTGQVSSINAADLSNADMLAIHGAGRRHIAERTQASGQRVASRATGAPADTATPRSGGPYREPSPPPPTTERVSVPPELPLVAESKKTGGGSISDGSGGNGSGGGGGSGGGDDRRVPLRPDSGDEIASVVTSLLSREEPIPNRPSQSEARRSRAPPAADSSTSSKAVSPQSAPQVTTESTSARKSQPLHQAIAEGRALLRADVSPASGDQLYLGVDIPHEPISQLRSEIESRIGSSLEHRGEAHITVVHPAELGSIEKRFPTERRAEVRRLISEWASSDSLSSAPFTMEGVGRAAGKNGRQAYFIPVDSPSMRAFRDGLPERLAQWAQANGMPEVAQRFRTEPTFKGEFQPHITIGFIGGDVHGVPKDRSTVDPSLGVTRSEVGASSGSRSTASEKAVAARAPDIATHQEVSMAPAVASSVATTEATRTAPRSQKRIEQVSSPIPSKHVGERPISMHSDGPNTVPVRASVEQTTTRSRELVLSTDPAMVFAPREIDFTSARSHLRIHESGSTVAGSQFTLPAAEIERTVVASLPERIQYDANGRAELTISLTNADGSPRYVGFDGELSVSEFNALKEQYPGVRRRFGQREPGGERGTHQVDGRNVNGVWRTRPDGMRTFTPDGPIFELPPEAAEGLRTNRVTLIVMRDRETGRPRVVTMFPGDNAPAYPGVGISAEGRELYSSISPTSLESAFWRSEQDPHGFVRFIPPEEAGKASGGSESGSKGRRRGGSGGGGDGSGGSGAAEHTRSATVEAKASSPSDGAHSRSEGHRSAQTTNSTPVSSNITAAAPVVHASSTGTVSLARVAQEHPVIRQDAVTTLMAEASSSCAPGCRQLSDIQVSERSVAHILQHFPTVTDSSPLSSFARGDRTTSVFKDSPGIERAIPYIMDNYRVVGLDEARPQDQGTRAIRVRQGEGADRSEALLVVCVNSAGCLDDNSSYLPGSFQHGDLVSIYPICGPGILQIDRRGRVKSARLCP